MAEFSIPYLLTTPRGTVAFNDGADPGYVLIEDVPGLDGGELSVAVDPLSGRDGGVVHDGFVRHSYPVLTGLIQHAGSFTVRRHYEETIRAYTDSLKRADGTLSWLPSGMHAATYNLVPNGGFESAVAPWTNSGTFLFLGTGAALARVTTEQQSGLAALRITTTATALTGASIDLGVLTAGTVYVTTFYAKGDIGATMEAKIGDIVSGDATTVGFTLTAAWQLVTVTWTATAAGNTQLAVRSPDAGARVCYIDSVMVRPSGTLYDDETYDYGTYDGALEYVETNGAAVTRDNRRYKTVRAFRPVQISTWNNIHKRFQVSLVSGDPYALTVTERQLTSGPLAAGTVDLYVPNDGTAASPPTLRITGPVTDPTVTNVTTGEALTLDYTLTAGHYLDIDCAALTALYDGAAVATGSLSPSSKFFLLEPGANTLRLAGTGGSGAESLRVTFRDAWVG